MILLDELKGGASKNKKNKYKKKNNRNKKNGGDKKGKNAHQVAE
jgi:hypothetical protein